MTHSPITEAWLTFSETWLIHMSADRRQQARIHASANYWDLTHSVRHDSFIWMLIEGNMPSLVLVPFIETWLTYNDSLTLYWRMKDSLRHDSFTNHWHKTHQSHVTHMRESCLCHAHQSVSCHTCECMMSHMSESCHTHAWVTSRIWEKHVTHVNESRHTYGWIVSHIKTCLMSDLTNLKEPNMSTKRALCMGVCVHTGVHAWLMLLLLLHKKQFN